MDELVVTTVTGRREREIERCFREREIERGGDVPVRKCTWHEGQVWFRAALLI